MLCFAAFLFIGEGIILSVCIFCFFLIATTFVGFFLANLTLTAKAGSFIARASKIESVFRINGVAFGAFESF
jgi:hypothetical protein